jgi:hypothetical protein
LILTLSLFPSRYCVNLVPAQTNLAVNISNIAYANPVTSKNHQKQAVQHTKINSSGKRRSNPPQGLGHAAMSTEKATKATEGAKT